MNRLRLAVVFVLLAGCGRGEDSLPTPSVSTGGPAVATHPNAIAEAQKEDSPVNSDVRSDSDTWSDVMKAAGEAQHRGDYRRAKVLFTQALSKAEAFDDTDPRLTETRIYLAEPLLELGEYARSEQLCIESIGAVEEQFGEKHLQITQAEKILARLYYQLGMSVLADRHCKRGLKICESIHGRRHPDVAELQAMMRYIWNLRSGSGDSSGAGKALEFLEKSFGKSDPRLIVPLEAIAGDCYDRWTPTKAARAVSIAETNYGKAHPVYGRCLSTYATALRHIHDFEESELVSKQAIAVLASSLGPDHPQLSAAYRNLASIERDRGHSDQAEARFRDSIRLRFSTLSDAELCHFFEQFLDSDQSGSYDDDLLDTYLTEMTRRGGEVIQQFLTSAIERSSRNPEFVTALCRIQKKTDPLQIFVEGPQELTCEYPELPAFNVTIRNVDSEKREIGFQESGDYRSGRQARWRIEARDAAGQVQPFKDLHGIIHGGGIFQPTTLKTGEGWETTLNMARFVETLKPGEYQVRVLYHNDLTIVDWEFVAGLIVCRSEPIKLTIKRRTIQMTKKEKQEIKELLARFDDRQTCKIIDGKYGEWAHEFIDPKSEYGRLLKLSWLAVPTLIEELEHKGQTPERRAHLLSLLFSITGENNPSSPAIFGFGESAALGTYSILEQGWSISSKRAGEDEAGSSSSGFTSGPSTHKAKLDAKAQAPFIERWQKFKPRYEVISRD